MVVAVEKGALAVVAGAPTTISVKKRVKTGRAQSMMRRETYRANASARGRS
jgi:hypothetical protein